MLTVDNFAAQVSNAQVLDGDLRLVDGGENLEKVNFGGALRRVVSSSAKTSMVGAAEENRAVRTALLNAIEHAGLDATPVRELLLGDAVQGRPLSRRTVRQVLTMVGVEGAGGVAEGRVFKDLKLTQRQFDGMFDRALKIACDRHHGYEADLAMRVSEYKDVFAHYGTGSDLENELLSFFDGSLDDDSVADTLAKKLFAKVMPKVSQKHLAPADAVKVYDAQVAEKIARLDTFVVQNGQSKLDRMINFSHCESYNTVPPTTGERAVKNLVADLFANADAYLLEKSGLRDGERILQTLASNWTLFCDLVNGAETADTRSFHRLLETLAPDADAQLRTFLAQAKEIVGGEATQRAIMQHVDELAAKVVELGIENALDAAADAKLKASGADLVVKLGFSGAVPQQQPITVEDLKGAENGTDINALIARKQGGYNRFVGLAVDKYFRELGVVDRRLLMANAVRQSERSVADCTGLECKALLKGVGPAMAKILQGVNTETIQDEGVREAVGDMKANLPPIDRRVVQAEILKLIESNPNIDRIDVEESLGCASVGQAFKVKIHYKDGRADEDAVIKLIRPDANERLAREVPVIKAAAERVPGMWKTYKGQMATFKKELDLTLEGANVRRGVKTYNAKLGNGTVGQTTRTFTGEYGKDDDDDVCGDWTSGESETICFQSMSLVEGIQPTKSCMVMKFNGGDTIDRLVKKGETAKAELVQVKAEIRRLEQEVDDFENDNWGLAVSEDQQRQQDDRRARIQELTARKGTLTAQLQDITRRLVRTSAGLRQVTREWVNEGLFKSGFYHGDLHAGNMIADAEGNVTLIDFGNAGDLGNSGVMTRLVITIGRATESEAAGFFLKDYESLVTDGDTKARLADPNERMKLEYKLSVILEKAHEDPSLALNVAMAFLQSEGLEIPNAFFNFSQAELRLSQTVQTVQRAYRDFQAALGSDCVPNAPGAHPTWNFDDHVGYVFNAHKFSVLGDMVFNNMPGYTAFVRDEGNEERANEAEVRLEVTGYAIEHGLEPKTLLDGFIAWHAGRDGGEAPTVHDFNTYCETLH